MIHWTREKRVLRSYLYIIFVGRTRRAKLLRPVSTLAILTSNNRRDRKIRLWARIRIPVWPAAVDILSVCARSLNVRDTVNLTRLSGTRVYERVNVLLLYFLFFFFFFFRLHVFFIA